MKNLIILISAFVIISCVTKEKESSINQIDLAESEEYKEGLKLLSEGDLESFNKSIAIFNDLLKKDPNFTPAYVGLSKAYLNLGPNFNILSPEETNPKAIKAIENALKTDSTSIDVLLTLATVNKDCKWDWEATRDTYIKALQLHPGNPQITIQYAMFLNNMDRTDDAIALINAIDENQDVNKAAIIAFLNRDMNKMIENWNKTVQSNPDASYNYWRLAILYSRIGDHEKAINMLDKQIPMMVGDIDDELALKGYNLGKLGKIAEAKEVIKKLDEIEGKGEYVSPILKAWVYCGIGDSETAKDYIKKGYETHAHRAGSGLRSFDFIYSDLNENPQFMEILDTVSL